MTLDLSIESWRKYLRFDPTRFLLAAEDEPWIQTWYMVDIANRPEESKGVVETRERVLFSDPVQRILAAQAVEGYWENSQSLGEPRYRATIWNLALLAELGLPRASRRARLAAWFALEKFIGEINELVGVHDSFALASFVRAAAYFGFAADARVSLLALGLAERFKPARVPDALALLWALGRWPGEQSGLETRQVRLASETLLTALSKKLSDPPLTFPHFHPQDTLLSLRVLAEHGRAGDPRAATALARLTARQDRHARWPLDRSLNSQLTAPLEEPSSASRWITLNALRVIKSVVTITRG